MNALITGFEPFGGDALNPAELVLRSLPEQIGKYQVRRLLLPVVYQDAEQTLENNVTSDLDLILCLGQAGGSAALAFERVAVNLDECRSPDNAGDLRMGQPIDPNAPPAYFSALPVYDMAEAASRLNIPARVSYSAGAYVCNHVMFTALRLAERIPGCRAGFIHMPYIPEQGKQPSLPLDTIRAGILAAIETL